MTEEEEKTTARRVLKNAIYLKAVEALDHLLGCNDGGFDKPVACDKCRELLKDYALLRCAYGKF